MKKPTFKENVDSFVTLASKIIRFPKDVIEYIKLGHSVIQVTVGVKIKNTLKNINIITMILSLSVPKRI